MKCSTGKDETPTPKGTFQGGTGPGARWHYFKKFDCWAQYAYYIQGDIMFHSVLYNQKDGPVTQSSVNNLGRKASHGCVRLSVEDAKWVYSNCPRNTKIIVY
jgi:lipoprotein-anchoring transpeptidase ErfK/SrfK